MESAKESEVREEERKHKRSCITDFRQYFREYCQCTSIHGFRYFGERRTIFERVFWLVVFTAALSVLSWVIYLVYDKWHSSPVLVSFATTETPIHNIPFPAVTICPQSKMRSSRFNFTDTFHKICKKKDVTKDEEKYFNYLSLICDRPEYECAKYLANKTFPDTYYEDLIRLAPPLTIWGCKFMGRQKRCYHLWHQVLTEQGICYSFNIMDRSYMFNDNVRSESLFYAVPKNSTWSLETGYLDTGDDKHVYPRRALLSGADNGLFLKLAVNRSHIDYMCKDLQGFRIAVHSPLRVPRPNQDFFRVPLDQAVIVSVEPTLMKTSKSVRRYDPEKRQCYFPGEKYLAYFKRYSQSNCELECLTNHTLMGCGCVNFYMPRFNGTVLCGTGKMRCMDEAAELMHEHNMQFKVETKAVKLGKLKGMRCDCKPMCTELTYKVTTSQTDWDWPNAYWAAHRMDDLVEDFGTAESVHLSSLTIYFKQNHFITLQRTELYGPTDFLANFGGLLGLFTGFSILSLMEIVYFLSVRLICNTKLFGHWAGPAANT